jgi:predicted NUDIX family NTP pyrophosphohydrolase
MPGGHIDPGETPDHAARRELFEETGIRVPVSALKLVRVETRRKGNYYFYRVDMDVKPPVTLSFEHDKYIWVDENKTNPEWLPKYFKGADTSKMTAEQKQKEALVGAGTALGTRAAAMGVKKQLAKRAAAKTAATVGAKVAAKQGIKAAGAGVPIVGWAVTGALMTYDAAPEAYAVGKEGVAKGKKTLSDVRAAKGVKEKAKALGRGYVEGVKHGAAGVARVGTAAIVGSDVVKMGREAYAEKQMKKNGVASAAGKAALTASRGAARRLAAKAGSRAAVAAAPSSLKSLERVARLTPRAIRAAEGVLMPTLKASGKLVGTAALAVTGGALAVKGAKQQIQEVKAVGKQNPADLEANVSEINKLLRTMPPAWKSQLDSNRNKLRAAGAAAAEIPPAKPNAHNVLLALNLNNRGDVSSEAAAGQEQPGGNPVPDDVREAAMEGIRLSHAHDYGGYDFIGVARAIQLAVSPTISDAALNRMRMYFDRKTKQDRLSSQYKQKSGKRYMSWLNWGGDPGAIWSKSKRYRELVGKGNPFRNPNRGIGVEQILADVYGEEWANWDLNRAGIMHYSPKGIPTSRSIVKTNPSEFKPEAFDQRLRRMGMTGHTLYRDDEGELVKRPKMVMFDSPDAALQALAVFLVLENIDTRGASPVEMQPRHAAVRLRDGRIYEATLRQDGKALDITVVGEKGRVDWFHWARLGDYPALARSR